MKHRRFLRILRHAITMVRRTIRSYGLLSVTIVLSFTLLLGFLGYMDTSLYNEYKGVFMVNRGTIKVADEIPDTRRFDALLQKSKEIPGTLSYVVRSANLLFTDAKVETSEGNLLPPQTLQVFFLPGHVWQFFQHLEEPLEVQWLDGTQHREIGLKPGEAILDTGTFRALGLDKLENPIYTFRLHNGTGESVVCSVKITGLVDYPEPYFIRKDGVLTYNPDYLGAELILLLDDSLNQALKDAKIETSRYAIFYTENPKALDTLAKEVGIDIPRDHAMYRIQDEAMEKIQTQKRTKALLAGVLLLLLGVNLYSSFTNALNDRKYEIGVKRAIGASRFSIVRQFLYEGLLVMTVNILVSIAIVVDLGLLLKIVMEARFANDSFYIYKYWDYILYLSPYSAAMFGICAISLTVVFSLIFAYKSTQVEIVDYLKAE